MVYFTLCKLQCIFALRGIYNIMVQFKALSLSYKTAPVEISEQIALNEQNINNLLQQIKEFTSATDTLILSTCNRTEIYYSSESDLTNDLVKLIGCLLYTSPSPRD